MQNDHRSRRLRARGIAITVLLGVITILVICVMTMGTVTVQTLGVARSMTIDKQAWYVAEAGVRDAVRELRNDLTWSAGYTDKPLVTNTGHKYTVTVTNNEAGTTAVTAPDGTSVSAGFAYVVSVGTTDSGEKKKVSAMARRESVFQYAVFGDKFVEYGGSGYIDAWSSNGGAVGYTTGRREGDPGVLVGTNGQQDAAIHGFGSANVYGGVSAGPGSDVNTAIDADGHYTGTASANSGLPMPGVTVPLSGTGPDLTINGGTGKGKGGSTTTTINPGVYGSLKATGGSITLKTGTYYFTGDVSIGGNATVNIDSTGGPVVIYVAGDWDSSGATIVNSSQQAWNLQLYGTETCESVKLAGGSNTYMVTYAPHSEVVIVGTADLYGSIIGKSIDITGGALVHYDTELANRILGPYFWETTAWHRW